MHVSLRCYIEMDNESLCGCVVFSYALLFCFGDFHDWLMKMFWYYLDYFEWSIKIGYLGV